MKLFEIVEPTVTSVPIIISSPHSGTYFPEAIKSMMHPEMVNNPDDTDWFIDRLYNFASGLGITMIKANYNRWVIDLNRNPDNKPLYKDDRVITELVPTQNFNGKRLYIDDLPSQNDIDFRLEHYYKPYHSKIESLLNDTKAKFGKALLFDAHSIRKVVPGIQKETFPNFILSDYDETTASKAIIETSLTALKTSKKIVTHNHPFKGGYITRSFGNRKKHIHSIQLEMIKTNYMDDSETHYHQERAEATQNVLKHLFNNIINVL